MARHRAQAMTGTGRAPSAPRPARRWPRSVPTAFVVTLIMAAAAAVIPMSDAAWVGTTTSTGSFTSTLLTGTHAPASGTPTFSATRTSSGGCDLAWSALSGGTTVADRYEVTDGVSGSSVTTTATGNVGAGAYSATPPTPIVPYRLGTRSGTNWVSAAADGLTATCRDGAVAAISVGTSVSCAVKLDGSLWCWGGPSGGIQLDSVWYTTANPTQIGSSTAWRQISVGGQQACGIQSDGSLWCWGQNWAGAVGDGTTTGRSAPVLISAGTTWAQVAALDSSTCAIRTDGTLWCWGANGVGQIGDGSTSERDSPVQIASGQSFRWIAGGDHTPCAVRSDATLWRVAKPYSQRLC